MMRFLGPVCFGFLLVVVGACGGGGAAAPVAGNQAPTVSVTSPAEDIEIPLTMPTTVDIDYVDADPDSVATTDILADQDGDPDTTGDQVVIAAGLPDQDGAPQSVTWDPAAAPPGTYKILAVTSDAGSRAVAVGPGTVMLNAPPTLSITSPTIDIAVSRGAVVPISYVDNDGDDAALTWLFADMDGDFDTTGDLTQIATARPELNGLPQTVRWDTTGTSFGLHGIHARSWDGSNTLVQRTATGQVDVQNVATAASAGGTEIESGMGIAAFPDGSSVVVGYFAGSPTFGLGELTETTPTAVGGDDLFIARYWSTGALRWARAVGGSTSDVARSVTALSDGSCVVTGWFEGTVTFGPLEANQTILTSTGVSDLFIARYNANGTLAWAKQAGGTAAGCYGLAIDAYADNSFAVTGSFFNPVTFGPGEAGQTTLTYDTGFDAFVARFNANGTLAWAKRAHGAGNEEGLGIATFGDGTCVVTGYFDDTVTWGPGEAGQTSLLPFGFQEVFVARYGTTGTFLWVNQQGGFQGAAAGLDVATYSDGSCVVCGWFNAAMDFGFGEPNETNVNSSGQSDSFVAQFDSAGFLNWARTQGGLFFDSAEGVEVLPDGGCALTGWIEFGAVFGVLEPNETLLLTSSGRDVFLARFASDGDLRWTRSDGGPALELQSRALARFPDGSFGITGFFTDDSVLFGRGGNKARPVFNAGQDDIFYARYNADGGF